MAANNEELQNVFLTSDKEIMLLMLKYIREELNIPEADYWNFIGYNVIHVPKDQYEYVLLNGKKYACEKDWGMYWINFYNQRRSPIASYDIGYGLLPKTKIPGEEEPQYKDRSLWGRFEENTPRTILEYFKSMKKFLKIDKIIKSYIASDDAIRITPVDQDYEAKSKLFKEFVETYGYGPFREVHPLKFNGEYVKEPILIRERKKTD